MTVERFEGGMVLTGHHIKVYSMLALASALRLCAKGIRVNAAWTPTVMLRSAESHTGRKFKRGEYLLAADALREKAEELSRVNE